jgi:hypothetical protein
VQLIAYGARVIASGHNLSWPDEQGGFSLAVSPKVPERQALTSLLFIPERHCQNQCR